jgi:hypothetical protein
MGDRIFGEAWVHRDLSRVITGCGKLFFMSAAGDGECGGGGGCCHMK